MSILSKLSDAQIREIAGSIDAGFVCYIHAGTGEMIFMMNEEMLDYNGMSGEDEADMAKIDSWGVKNTIRIDKPASYEAFAFMERFVDEVIPEGRLKEDFERALSKSHPFRNFNAIVKNCEYLDDWYEFKQNAMEAYVRRELDCWEDKK